MSGSKTKSRIRSYSCARCDRDIGRELDTAVYGYAVNRDVHAEVNGSYTANVTRAVEGNVQRVSQVSAGWGDTGQRRVRIVDRERRAGGRGQPCAARLKCVTSAAFIY